MATSWNHIAPKSNAVVTFVVLAGITAAVAADLPEEFYRPDNYYAPGEGQPDGISYMGDTSYSGPGRPASSGFMSDWTNSNWGMHSGLHPTCIDIPDNLTLCRNIGYEQMRLPNLVEHETLSEVAEQARMWQPLLAINCHPDTKVFLCSLFAPICLPGDHGNIYPCRSLCEAVRDSCAPRMRERGFPWPEMMRCDKFPLDNDMCVKKEPEAEDVMCRACNQPVTFESIVDNYCRSDIVMKVRLRKGKKRGTEIEIATGRKKRFIKKGSAKSLPKRTLRSLDVTIPDAQKCECSERFRDVYLVSGDLEGEKFHARALHRYDRQNNELKRALRAIRKSKELCRIRGAEILTSDVIQNTETEEEPAARPRPTIVEASPPMIVPASSNECPPCAAPSSEASVTDIFCLSDVIVRMRITGETKTESATQLSVSTNHMKVYKKPDTLTTSDLAAKSVSIGGTQACVCQLTYPEKYVIAGRSTPDGIFALGLYKFDNNNSMLKNSLKSLRKNSLSCGSRN